jgi:hypothetical protein
MKNMKKRTTKKTARPKNLAVKASQAKGVKGGLIGVMIGCVKGPPKSPQEGSR